MIIISNKLPLDDARWASLSSTGKHSARVPGFLEYLGRLPRFDRSSDAWVLLVDHIFHQFTCYESTYASFPYLVELGSRLPADGAEDLWITLGQIAGCFEVYGVPAPEELEPAFRDALEVAERVGVSRFLATTTHPLIVRDHALATVALSGHRMGLMVTSNLSHLSAEGEAVCPACDADFLFGVHDDGLSTYTSLRGPFPVNGDPSQPRRLAPLRALGEEMESPWRSVARLLERRAALPAVFVSEWQEELDAAARQCRFGLRHGDARCTFCVVGALLALHGDLAGAARFLRLSGGVRCPTCKREHHVVDVLPELRQR